MTFLSPLLLWFLAAASVPVIIHLLNKRRHKTVQWAAMQFLLKATRESRGKKKLRHILILTCRALGIAALAFAAARPVVSGLLGWGAGTIDTVVLVLDRSASMEIRSGDGQAPRRDLVLQKVRDAMSSLGNPRLVLIDSASGKAQEIPSPEVLAEISATAPTGSSADFPDLLTTATEYLSGVTGRSELWLASDLQSSNWRPEDENWAAVRASLASLPQPPSVRVLSLTGESAPNTSFRLLGTRRIADGLILDLELIRSDDSRGSLVLPVTVSTNGASTTDSVSLPGQSLRFQKTIRIKDETETGTGWLSIPADGNPQDNAVFFAYGPARPVKTLVVSSAGEAAGYLALAAAPPGFEKQSAELVDPAAFPGNTGEISMILWAAPLPTGENARRLQDFLSNGGQVAFLPSPDVSENEFAEMKWQPVTSAEAGKFYILQDWDKTDGPLRDGLDGNPIPAERLRAIKRSIPEGDATVLARWEDGEPFITRKIVGRGTIWFIGSIPDYTWSNLGDADVLLPAAQRILALGADRFDSSFLAEVGSDSATLLPGETRSRIDDFAAINSPYEAGVFRLGERLVAINRPGAEDDLTIATRENLDTMLDGTGYRLLDQAGRSADPSLSTDMWRAFLLAVLIFLISEALLCLPKKRPKDPSTKGVMSAAG
ncbi:MAG: BatA and WFA domain-containing protein [Akkermansiaceae bacterium]|nr:BatA and WFA domain-containing protein [Akkermansiaceae bacterium]MDP4647654.1 BatA and WFA domain-containing protein [Akkermansiaceae bacterium]MDP4722287.1 BatA and WFA domain-containing protein [Akkermansiaceae bacterium]MDP4780327.1 BatA and WFA domain-containing protein [Akkermansiaceae bacterium]MDP4846189.1 BatA and WFA domain-containing protein [Akkermansiaceae bacterium]